MQDVETEELIKAMRALVEESRRLARRHQELLKEYEQLHQELDRRRRFAAGGNSESK